MTNYYAYVHARPKLKTARAIFHVGKGSKNRAYHFTNSRNQEYRAVAKKVGHDKIVIGILECSSEQFALDLERGLIKRLRAMGVKLTNETGGGLGTFRPKEELRIKLAPNWQRFGEQAVELNRARIWTEEAKAVLAVKSKVYMTGMSWITNGIEEKRFPKNKKPPIGWKFGRLPKSEETCAKIAVSLLGNSRTKGKIWITDGTNNRVVAPSMPVPEGWRRGITR